MIIDSFASEGFSIASDYFAELDTRLGPLPTFNVSGDFSIGAWGFISEPMNLVVSQHVYVARWVCVAKDHVTLFSEPDKGAIVFHCFHTCNNFKVFCSSGDVEVGWATRRHDRSWFVWPLKCGKLFLWNV